MLGALAVMPDPRISRVVMSLMQSRGGSKGRGEAGGSHEHHLDSGGALVSIRLTARHLAVGMPQIQVS